MRTLAAILLVALLIACGAAVVGQINALDALSGKIDALTAPLLSGQVVESHGVRTERWVNESLPDWAARHGEAVKEFGHAGN